MVRYSEFSIKLILEIIILIMRLFQTKKLIGLVISAYKVSTKKLLIMLDVWAGYRLTSCYGLFIVPFVFGCDFWKAEPRMFE